MANTQLKAIVEQLNALLNKNYNLISFDSLNEEQLLQVVTDVLGEIDKNNKVDIHQEDLEETAVRILEMLRILKYKLNPRMSVTTFHQGLIQGDKHVIHPILEWLLANMDDLKKRSYLAQFLVKLDVPPEMLGDPDISFLYEQYESQIEEFKDTHKKYEALKSSGMSITELRTDITAMEKEKDSVEKKIEKLRQRIENVPGKTALLESAKALREEKQKEKELSSQAEQQTSQIMVNDQRLRRLQVQLKELKQSSAAASAEKLLRKLEEECSVNNYIAKQKLPQEIKNRQVDVKILESVMREPNITHADLEELNNQIQQIGSEINEMVEKHLATQNVSEDKNAPFRQQASIIAKKKENKAEQLGELRNALSNIEEEFEEKQGKLKELAGDTILRGEEFKKYANKLKGRTVVYKQNRAELSALKSESSILTRTLEILKSRDQNVTKALEKEEAEHGVLGFRDTVETLEKVTEETTDFDSVKGKTLDEMSILIQQLSRRIEEKKTELAPLISELRPLREQFQELSEEYEHKKKMYDSTASALENNVHKLLEEVEKLKTSVEESEKEISTLEAENKRAKEYSVKVGEELKIYVSSNPETRKNSLREQLNQKINEQEKLGKHLREEQKVMKDIQSKRALQVQYWKDLVCLMECKKKCFEENKKRSGVVRREQGAETLILSQ
ncbi:hypothetical protein RUM44_007321 [Polyplax serrata]|uniref:IFT81 calponin homology domain-containing protein n=1 Tax=Polyplax serrata TaxID=468196 RepID=A0ABR1B0D4_POLSC